MTPKNLDLLLGFYWAFSCCLFSQSRLSSPINTKNRWKFNNQKKTETFMSYFFIVITSIFASSKYCISMPRQWNSLHTRKKTPSGSSQFQHTENIAAGIFIHKNLFSACGNVQEEENIYAKTYNQNSCKRPNNATNHTKHRNMKKATQI